VQLVQLGGVVQVAMVLPGSSAATAGVVEGDEVTAIDGAPVSEWTPDRVTETLEQGKVGSRHTLEVKRAGAAKTLTLTLKEML
jgi:C-terminal processing protease CtpA/Prc